MREDLLTRIAGEDLLLQQARQSLCFVGKGENTAMDDLVVRVLLIEDDEDDYVLVRSLLDGIPSARFRLDWISTFEEGVTAIERGDHDVCLVDYRLGDRDGIELLQKTRGVDCGAPIIILTGHGNYELDIEAMHAGAADYLLKGQINAHLLERSIRYAIDRKRSERQLKLLSSQLISAQEEERRRIARELHDSIGSSLSAIKFSLENTLSQVKEGKAASSESLKALVSMTQTAIEESRRIMTDLRPSILDDLGIIATVQWFCRQFQTIYPIIHVERHISVEEEQIPEDLKTVIFRILQEGLHNIAKYSRAELVNVTLQKQGRYLSLLIEDNGAGFDLDLVYKEIGRKGLGLASMKERAELTCGSFSIESVEGNGTTIVVSWLLPF